MNKITNVSAINYVLENCEVPAEYVEKLTKIRDSFANKSGNRKPTARQTENVQLQADIKAFIESGEGAVTATEILNQFMGKYNDLNLPRVSAQLAAMVKANEIDRYMDKKKAYFKAIA